MAIERAKPAKLQVNIFSSTWKDVVRFDAANDFQSMEVMDAAATLGRNSFDNRPRFRIVRDDPAFTGQDAIVITEWAPGDGWKGVQHG
ncbi:MAG: hypothetical protein ACT6S0_26845 [Roseateles sp.]|uniref:hypothetical protein n=1 Tax=Roseateles sp. TaxID=1971397 RepID=UPI004035D424